jgi:hypothetical protein
MGYTIMLEMVDKIWLASSAEGTVVQLERFLVPQEEKLTLLDRFQ